MATQTRVDDNQLPLTAPNSASSATIEGSLQMADVVIVSCDTRGFTLAEGLARIGWKSVVIEVDGGVLNAELDWADRLGPFLSWEPESESSSQSGAEKYGALWLKSGPVAWGGAMAASGAEHLRLAYGATIDGDWPERLLQSLVSPRLLRRESFADGDFVADDLRHVLETPIKELVSSDNVRRYRRGRAIAAGVRVIDADQITALRLSDQRVDRVEFKVKDQIFVERTRSLVWMLSEAESERSEYIARDIDLAAVFSRGRAEPMLAWWRTRLAIQALRGTQATTLSRLPEMPPHLVVLGSPERPWTHDNLIVMNLIEATESMRVFDVWIRIPFWSRADHVYRDEQRLSVQTRLADRLIGCELQWVTPSPLALTESAIRMPHVLYSESSRPPGVRSRNCVFAGPETWPAIGFLGVRAMEPKWIDRLEAMRREWDAAAQPPKTPMEKLVRWSKQLRRPRGRTSGREMSP